MGDLLQTQHFYTFNPHLVLKNVTQAVEDLKDVHDVAFLRQFFVETVSIRRMGVGKKIQEAALGLDNPEGKGVGEEGNRVDERRESFIENTCVRKRDT